MEIGHLYQELNQFETAFKMFYKHVCLHPDDAAALYAVAVGSERKHNL